MTRPRGCARATTWAPSTEQAQSAADREQVQQMQAAQASRESYQQALRRAGRAAISTEIRPAPPFYFAEPYHQQYLDANPQGYCGLGGTGVACPPVTAASG